MGFRRAQVIGKTEEAAVGGRDFSTTQFYHGSDFIQMKFPSVFNRADTPTSMVLHFRHSFSYHGKVSREQAFCPCATTRLYASPSGSEAPRFDRLLRLEHGPV